MNPVLSFRRMLEQVPAGLAKLPPDVVSSRPAPDAWSPKQELGHLLDSAIMNHQRLLRTLAEENPVLPGYDGPLCVAAHNYHYRDWRDLIATWLTLNMHFLWAVERVSDSGWLRRCTVDGKPITLEFLVTDYIDHALQHLRHMGVVVEPEKSAAAS